MKCPCCSAAELVSDTRDIQYTYKGETTTFSAVTGEFCPACGEVVLNHKHGDRYSKLLEQFQRQVDAARADRALTGAIAFYHKSRQARRIAVKPQRRFLKIFSWVFVAIVLLGIAHQIVRKPGTSGHPTLASGHPTLVSGHYYNLRKNWPACSRLEGLRKMQHDRRIHDTVGEDNAIVRYGCRNTNDLMGLNRYTTKPMPVLLLKHTGFIGFDSAWSRIRVLDGMGHVFWVPSQALKSL